MDKARLQDDFIDDYCRQMNMSHEQLLKQLSDKIKASKKVLKPVVEKDHSTEGSQDEVRISFYLTMYRRTRLLHKTSLKLDRIRRETSQANVMMMLIRMMALQPSSEVISPQHEETSEAFKDSVNAV